MSDIGLTSESMLVKMENLNQLLQLAGDVIIASSNLEFTYKKLQNLYYKRYPLDSDTLAQARELTEITSSISSNLHHLVQAIRMVNLKDIIFRARRTVRETARKTSKRVNLVVEGEETTIDKVIVEALNDPIAHQLRNAVSHGVENPQIRENMGKSDEGTITLRAYKTESEVFIEIEDDGSGVNMAALRSQAVQMGKLSENDPFTVEDALDFMCQPGVSTARDVSEVSGRGVGMDVVREDIEKLGGAIYLKTEEGKGTTFTFQLPLVSAVNILDTLVVCAGLHQFAFPITAVVATISLTPDQIHKNPEGRVIKYLDRFLPLFDLNCLLDPQCDPKPPSNERIPVIIIEHKDRIALSVDSFEEPQKLVVNPFDGVIQVQGLSGTTILGGKKLGLIIDVPSLINRALGIKKEVSDAVGFSTSKLETGSKETGDSEMGSRKEFIIEVEKLAGGLNEVVFALESEPESHDHMNRAFRLFHTTKGNLIMMGFPESGKTIHAVESILDRARCGQLSITPEVVDVLMDGVSFIEELVRLSKSGQWEDGPSENILQQSQALLPDRKSDIPDVVSSNVILSPNAAFKMGTYRRCGTPVYHAYIEFDSGMQPAFLVGCLIYKRFTEAGDVLGALPALDVIEQGLIENKMKIVLAAKMEQSVLEKALLDLLKKHYGVTLLQLKPY